MEVYKWYKVSRFLYLHHVPALPGIIKASIRILWGGVIPYQADIGEGTVIGYQGIGVVIHKRCVLGKNCHISQNERLEELLEFMRCLYLAIMSQLERVRI